MEGKQKLFFLPEPHTDFIFAVIGEEFGLLGTLFVVCLFAVFLWRGVRAASSRATPSGAIWRRASWHDLHSGVLQHQRGTRAAAHQRHSTAVHFVRRIVAVRDAGERRHAAECYPTIGIVSAHKKQIPRPKEGLVMTRVILAGGGTGGHVIPAIAIANELRDRYGAEVVFIGTARGIETRLVPAAGYRLELVKVGALNQVSAGDAGEDAVRSAARGTALRFLFQEFKPDVVISVGGYASGPAMMAVAMRGVPSVDFRTKSGAGICESNGGSLGKGGVRSL